MNWIKEHWAIRKNTYSQYTDLWSNDKWALILERYTSSYININPYLSGSILEEDAEKKGWEVPEYTKVPIKRLIVLSKNGGIWINLQEHFPRKIVKKYKYYEKILRIL